MSVDRIHGKVVFTCDACDDTLETGEWGFCEALAVFEEAGWKGILIDGKLENRCPDCIVPPTHPARSSVDDFK